MSRHVSKCPILLVLGLLDEGYGGVIAQASRVEQQCLLLRRSYESWGHAATQTQVPTVCEVSGSGRNLWSRLWLMAR